MNDRIRQIIKVQLRQMMADPREMFVIREEGSKSSQLIFLRPDEVEKYKEKYGNNIETLFIF